MAKQNYIDKLAGQIAKSMKGEKLDEALKGKRPADRIGMFQDLLIEAIKKSTLCCFNGEPYYYGGQIYEPLGKDGWDVFSSIIKRVADRCGMQPGDKLRLESVAKVCKREVKMNVLEIDSSIIVFNNGVVDVEHANSFYRFNKKYKQVTKMNFDYIPAEVPNIWLDFLDDVLQDKGMQNVLQEFMGAIFLDRRKVKIEKMLILKGPGGNGKSVVYETIKGLLGEENIKTIPISGLLGGSDLKYNIASINGKRLNYCTEISTKEFSDTNKLKAIISGEAMEARTLFNNNFTARNIPLLMANANRMPYIKDWSRGWSRKIIILPFDKTIPEDRQDRTLSIKMREAYPGIINWILDGRARLVANNYQFSVSQELQDAVDEYQSESSTVLQFMRAKDYNRSLVELVREPKWLEVRKLYLDYVKWCVRADITPESEKKFSMVLVEAGFNKKKTPSCMTIAVYTDKDERPIKEEYRKPNDVGMIVGMENLAHRLGVSRQNVEKAKASGYLDGCFTMEGGVHWFDVDSSRKAMKKFIKDTDKKKLYHDGKVSREVATMRMRFNKSMRKLKEPFRKADEPNKYAVRRGIIYVEDAFNYQLDKNDATPFLKFVDPDMLKNVEQYSSGELDITETIKNTVAY